MKKNSDIVKTVWKSWKESFKPNLRGLAITTILYSFALLADGVFKPIFYKGIFDTIATNSENVWKYLFFVAISLIASWIFNRSGDYFLVNSCSNTIRVLRNQSMFGLLLKNTHFFQSNFSGSLVTKSKRYSVKSEDVIDHFMFYISKGVLFVLFILIFMFSVNTLVAFIFIVWTLIFLKITITMSNNKIKLDDEYAKLDSKTTGIFSDILSSVIFIRVYSKEDDEFKKFKGYTQREHESRLKSWLADNLQWATQSILVLLLEIFVMWYYINRIINHQETIGSLALIQSYIGTLTVYMYNFGVSYTKLRSCFADANEMAEILQDKSNETEVLFSVSDKFKINTKKIEFENVTFSYENQDVIKNLNLEFESGKHYGIVGESGAGKSTLAKLLLRKYEVASGKIKISDTNISAISKPLLRNSIAYVQQHTPFPSRKIIDILRFGKNDATEDEIKIACEQAGCNFIWEKFSDGFDTYVGERGVKLSGGEAQRLSIAVAILKNAPIVIMDEPTSALDSMTESIIQNSIKKIFADKTLVIIAHRLSTVAILDEIVFLKDGKVYAKGSHNELLENCSEYAHLWELQTNPVL